MDENIRRANRIAVKKIDSRRVKRIRDEDFFKTLEEVFDHATLMALYDLLKRGFIDIVYGAVNSGKEAKVYWAQDSKGLDIAVKIYLTSTAEFKNSMLPYIVGDPRFKVVKRTTRAIVYTWARKEFANLAKAFEVGVRVPRPLKVNKNILLMEFVGVGGVPAPLLKDYLPSDLDGFFEVVLDYMRLLYQKGRLVHSDLSEYNIMVEDELPVFIDFGQAVVLDHPLAEEFLRRDVKNILRFFGRHGLDVPSLEEAILWVKGDSS